MTPNRLLTLFLSPPSSLLATPLCPVGTSKSQKKTPKTVTAPEVEGTPVADAVNFPSNMFDIITTSTEAIQDYVNDHTAEKSAAPGFSDLTAIFVTAIVALAFIAMKTTYRTRLRSDSVDIVSLYVGKEELLATFIVLLIPSSLYPYLVAVANRTPITPAMVDSTKNYSVDSTTPPVKRVVGCYLGKVFSKWDSLSYWYTGSSYAQTGVITRIKHHWTLKYALSHAGQLYRRWYGIVFWNSSDFKPDVKNTVHKNDTKQRPGASTLFSYITKALSTVVRPDPLFIIVFCFVYPANPNPARNVSAFIHLAESVLAIALQSVCGVTALRAIEQAGHRVSDNGLGGNLGAEFSGNGGITQDKVEQARKGRLSGLKSKNLLIWREENPEAVLAASSKGGYATAIILKDQRLSDLEKGEHDIVWSRADGNRVFVRITPLPGMKSNPYLKFSVKKALNIPVANDSHVKLAGHQGTLQLISPSRTTSTLRFVFPPKNGVLPKGFIHVFDPLLPNELLTPGSYSMLKEWTEFHANLLHDAIELVEDLIALEDLNDEAESDDGGEDEDEDSDEDSDEDE